jgi:lycopene cyclase domain-containing protein
MPFDPAYTYLLLNLAIIAVPLVRSFEPRIHYAGKWKRLFPAIAISGAIFITWDHFFTAMALPFEAAGRAYTGVWNFNPDYLTGIWMAGLPLEEWLFFLTVPYACVFIYEVLNYFVKRDVLRTAAPWITYTLIAFSLVMAITFIDRWYTAVTFFALAGMLVVQLLLKARYMGRFYLMFLVSIVPFALVNGVLTALPVVVYNNLEFTGVRLASIPLEDGFYGMLLLLLNITIYEHLNPAYRKDAQPAG